MADEATPSTSGGDFVARTRYGPVSYPADATNVPAAISQTDTNGAAPVLVINHRASMGGVADPVLDIMVVHNALEGEHFYNGPGYQSFVLYGAWSDLNGDKFIQNDGWDGDAANDVFFGTVTSRARGTAANDEWDGVTSAEYKLNHNERELVIYNTGYGYRWQGAYVIGFGANGVGAGSNNEGWAPAWTTDPISEKDGYHKTKISAGPDYWEGRYDNNLLVTNVWEAYMGVVTLQSLAGCDLTVEGCRQFAVLDSSVDANGNKNQPYDVDIHKSLDPAVEALMVNTVLPTYRNTLVNFNTTDSAIDDAILDSLNFTDDTIAEIEDMLPLPDTSDVDDAVNDTDKTINRQQGAADDIVFPSIYEGPLSPDAFGSNPFDYTGGWHPYMDVSVHSGCYAPLPAFIIFGACGQGAQGVTMKPGTDNYGVAPGTMFVFAEFGLWFDEDANGFITNHAGTDEEPINGCDDLRDCGNDDDPNEFPAGGNNFEFHGVCADFIVQVTPQTTGQVWPRGAYLMGDGAAPGNDHTTPAVQDITSDGDVDRLVNSGPIPVRMTCDSADPDEHFPDTFILLPAGNADFDVLATAEITQAGGDTGVCVTHNNGVIESTGTKECSFDTEIYESWAV
ncbi:MAG TPA: hypothetical protein VI997_03545 [Candidatus Thermoplasmatota archaeon]|nr:hypothetical protein [Candidatus Thermoplasmatota archaeon]